MTEPAAGRFIYQWHLTERCTQRCSHCYTHESAELSPRGRLEVLGRIEEHAARQTRPHIRLSGGEPALVPDLPDLLRAISQSPCGFTISVLSGGPAIGPDLLTALIASPLRSIQVSLDGSALTHDRIRGPGNHRAVCESIGRFAAAGLRVVVSFTAMRSNFRDLPQALADARSAGAHAIWTDRYIPAGSHQDPSQCLSPDETDTWLRLLDRCARAETARRGRRLVIHRSRALQFRGAGGSPYTCSAGRSLIAILPDGTVLPCRRLPEPIGRLPDHRLADILADSGLVGRIHGPIPSGCRNCHWHLHCRGGLRCLAHATKGLHHPDPGCSLSDPEGRDHLRAPGLTV